MTKALMQMKTYLIDVLGRVLFKIHRPPDFEVGLTVQVGGLDETHLHTRPSHVTLHCKTVQRQNILREHTWMLLIHEKSSCIINSAPDAQGAP